MNNKLNFLISLCKKSGNLLSGEHICEKAIRSKKAKLIIIADDASINTKNKFKNSSQFYKIPIYFYLSKEELGRIIGKDTRTVLVITDESFSCQIINLFNQN